MSQLEHIEAIERRLWSAADMLRANSSHASNEYFLPVMGLVFLRHAYSRYLAVKDDIEANLPYSRWRETGADLRRISPSRAPSSSGPRPSSTTLSPCPTARTGPERCAAMDSIENDYDSLPGVLAKSEYRELEGRPWSALRTLNPDELKQVSGDVFGRIYEYFLTQFADQKAHDGGEFFTPVSLVSLISHVLDPQRGTVLDPACGSGGMFVQSARTVEEHGQSPTERLHFSWLGEKRHHHPSVAKMNLAVHGLEGDIHSRTTRTRTNWWGRPTIMANPPRHQCGRD